MILIAALFLFPKAWLPAGGPDDAVSGGRAGARAVMSPTRDLSLVDFSSHPAGIGECAAGEWDDDEGTDLLLDGGVVPSSCRKGHPLSRRCSLAVNVPPPVRPCPLRC
jgi:hypothetical protein